MCGWLVPYATATLLDGGEKRARLARGAVVRARHPAVCYRKSWFNEIGVGKFPESWEQYRRAGKLLKAKGRPIGQTLGHTYNDAPAFTYPYLWSWGGKGLRAHLAEIPSRERAVRAIDASPV